MEIFVPHLQWCWILPTHCHYHRPFMSGKLNPKALLALPVLEEECLSSDLGHSIKYNILTANIHGSDWGLGWSWQWSVCSGTWNRKKAYFVCFSRLTDTYIYITRSFSSLHRFSMGFRSGDWLGRSRTLICFFLSHPFVAFAVCFGSLSCWETHPRPIFSALTEGRRLSPKISRYMAQFILSSTWWSRPVPLTEKHPQSIRFPPPCFTVGMVFLGLYSAFLFLQTRRVKMMPNSAILVSSDHITFSQASSSSSSSSSRCSLANFRRACTCAFFSRGTLHAQQDFNPSRCSVLLMVLFVTVVPTAFRSLTSSSCVVLGWSLTFLIIIYIPWGEIFGRLAVTLCFFHFLIIAPTVVNFSPSCLLIFL